MSSAAHAAVEHCECVICMEPLCSQPLGVLLDVLGIRVCSHTFHESCVSQCRHQACPVCRAEFAKVGRVPDIINETDEWFRLMDISGDGRLSQREVSQALRGALELDEDRIEEAVQKQWTLWDSDGDGKISRAEFGTAIQFVRKHVPGRQRRADPPDLRVDKAGWFAYWDDDSSGTLDKGEVARAVLKTLLRERPGSDRLQEVAETLDAVWSVLSPDSCEIDAASFKQEGGLADAICAQLALHSPRAADGGEPLRRRPSGRKPPSPYTASIAAAAVAPPTPQRIEAAAGQGALVDWLRDNGGRVMMYIGVLLVLAHAVGILD
eukprot:TRINITY_DN32166_c0_g1_i1.p1 TRINITY_DN32166_c0_g1~~TRINITY_DN32166_c0_g1_i1.p1  ORF type:complete len:338 (+),score=116.51 TRINITY_DN32166_c0_g1_i1:49-1014(+)